MIKRWDETSQAYVDAAGGSETYTQLADTNTTTGVYLPDFSQYHELLICVFTLSNGSIESCQVDRIPVSIFLDLFVGTSTGKYCYYCYPQAGNFSYSANIYFTSDRQFLVRAYSSTRIVIYGIK